MRFVSLRLSALAATVAFAVSGCGGAHSTPSVPEFDSAHSIALDGTVDQGRLVATSSDAATIVQEAQDQLQYTMGELNGLNGVADGRRTEVSVQTVTARADGLFDVTYAAKLFVSWPREVAVQPSLALVLPARGDYQGLSAFYAQYGNDEAGAKRCMDDAAHEVEQSVFWYYYRPFKAGCPLYSTTGDAASLAARFPIRLAVSGENTSGKSPEYAKVWEDGVLYATAIFGKYEIDGSTMSDAGISAYASFYNDLLRNFGAPISTTLPAGAQPGLQASDIEMVWNTPAGKMNVALLLVPEIRSVGPAFKARYNERTKISDYVSYSGHSGLGANIRALAQMGNFVPKQYQLYMVNGCDTFAYVDYSLRDAHAAVNPGFGPNKFFDIITNAMPSYFSMDSQSNIVILRALIGRSQTYRQILAGFDISQRANVTGEEDNGAPF